MTPPGFDVSPKTLEDLEWPRILHAVADRCSGPAGRRAALGLPFLDDEGAQGQLEAIRELQRFADRGELLPDAGVAILDEVFERLKTRGVLAAAELLEIATLGRRFTAVFAFVSKHRAHASRLGAIVALEADGAERSASLKRLEAEISGSFEPDGTLSDLASPELGRLRREARVARERLLGRLERLMDRHADLLQDRFYTQRDGRYVLPVRSDSHERLPGIVHGTSSSGATVFLEPRAAVSLGNTLRLAELEVGREEERILTELSMAAADELASLTFAQEALVRLDTLAAMARLGADLGAAFPRPAEPGSLDLRQACHPLMRLGGTDVVPNDITVTAGQALVISGPNAGGKTVALKTAGMLSLMARAGLPIPAADGSAIGLPLGVATDIGDEQSLQRNLSTFSAHMTNIAGIMARASAGTIVLLDELSVGTDPSQGAALAEAILEALVERGASVLVTTHYDRLKALAASDGRFRNASVALDLDTLTPTFVLTDGVPGTSSALEVASRFGIPEPVVRRAKDLSQDEGAGRFASTLDQIAAMKRRFEEAETQAGEARRTAESRERELDMEIRKMKERGKKAVDEASAEVISELQQARQTLRDASRQVKRRVVTSEAVAQARTHVEAVAERLSVEGDLKAKLEPGDELPGRPAASGDLRAGLAVYVIPYRSRGSVVEWKGGKEALVAVGSIKTRVAIEKLRVLEAGGGAAAGPRQPVPDLDVAADADVPLRTVDNTCDLRGLRVHEAVEQAEKFLDDQLRANRGVAFFIHGFGTGALQSTLKEYLGRSPYVSRFRACTKSEGGEGVTVAWIR